MCHLLIRRVTLSQLGHTYSEIVILYMCHLLIRRITLSQLGHINTVHVPLVDKADDPVATRTYIQCNSYTVQEPLVDKADDPVATRTYIQCNSYTAYVPLVGKADNPVQLGHTYTLTCYRHVR